MTHATPILVIGAGGHGRETISLLRDLEREEPGAWILLGVLADTKPGRLLLESLGISWLGPTSRLAELDARFTVALGEGAARSRLQAAGIASGRAPVTLIHPTASVGSDVEIGRGSYIGAQTALTTHVRLGDGVQVNIGCTLSHDVIVEDFATLAPGVHLAGGVLIEKGATVFTGAAVVPGVRVGAGAVVGAGAAVTKDVMAGETVAGVPAKPLHRN